MLLCRKHCTIALSSLPGKGIWFPVCPLKGKQSFHEAVDDFLQQFFAHHSFQGKHRPFSVAHPVEHLRLQVPQHYTFIERLIFYVELTFEHNSITDCCPPSPLLTWFRLDDVLKSSNLWGSEPTHLIDYAVHHQLHPPMYRLVETTIRSVLSFLSASPLNAEMLSTVGFDEGTILALYSQFVQHCFPSQSMNLFSFTHFLTLVEPSFNPQVAQAFFRSFIPNSSLLPTLHFHEFVLGLAVVHGQCPQGGRIGRIRIDYVCRYLNKV